MKIRLNKKFTKNQNTQVRRGGEQVKLEKLYRNKKKTEYDIGKCVGLNKILNAMVPDHGKTYPQKAKPRRI